MNPNFVEHVVEHYLARDRFRIEMLAYQSRHGRSGLSVGTPSHFQMNGHRPQDAEIHLQTVDNTRRGLKRVKPVTVEYLHELLHKDDMLSDFDHLHVGNDIFHYLIEEAVEL